MYLYIVSEFKLKQKLLLHHVVYNEKISRKHFKHFFVHPDGRGGPRSF